MNFRAAQSVVFIKTRLEIKMGVDKKTLIKTVGPKKSEFMTCLRPLLTAFVFIKWNS